MASSGRCRSCRQAVQANQHPFYERHRVPIGGVESGGVGEIYTSTHLSTFPLATGETPVVPVVNGRDAPPYRLSATLGSRFARLGRFPMGRAHPQGAVTRLCVKNNFNGQDARCPSGRWGLVPPPTPHLARNAENPRCQAPGRTSFLPRFRHVLRRYPPRCVGLSDEVSQWRCRRETIHLRQGYGGQAKLSPVILHFSATLRLCVSIQLAILGLNDVIVV